MLNGRFQQIRRFIAPLWALLAIFLTAPLAQAQQQCLDIFTKSPIEIQASANASELMGSLHEEARLNPEVLPQFTYELIRIASNYLARNGVLYTVRQKNDLFPYIEIIPGTATAINRFALMVMDKYNAAVMFDPASLIKFGYEAFVINDLYHTTFNHPLSLFLGMDLKSMLDSNRLLRDTTVLHELRHLDLHRNLRLRKPHPLFGDLTMEGDLFRDPHPHVAAYKEFLSFSEIKTFHTQAKEELTKLRFLIRRKAPVQDVLKSIADTRHVVEILVVLTYRVRFAIKNINEFQIDASTEIKTYLETDNIIYRSVTYKKGTDSELTLRLPLIHSRGLLDPRNDDLFKAQMIWLYKTNNNAIQQASSALKSLDLLQEAQTIQIAVDLIDQAQKNLSPTQLYAPEPVIP
jgi:hypothetical protein